MRTPIAGWKTHCHRGSHASSSVVDCSVERSARPAPSQARAKTMKKKSAMRACALKQRGVNEKIIVSYSEVKRGEHDEEVGDEGLPRWLTRGIEGRSIE